MKARLLFSLALLAAAIFLMYVAMRYFFEVYLPKGDCAGSVMFFTLSSVGLFALAVKMKPYFK